MPNHKKELDLVALEVDYRVGIMSIRALETKYKISKARIGQLAEEHEWVRDISSKVSAKAQVKLVQRLAEADTKIQASEDSAKRTKGLVETTRIDLLASLQADLLATHRSDIDKFQKMCNEFLNELHFQKLCDSDLAKIGELIAMVETQGDEAPDAHVIQKRLNAFYKLLGLEGRVDTLKKLVDAKAKLVELERLSHGIRDSLPPPPPGNPVLPGDELNSLTRLLTSLPHHG